jgi:hypothetical protein
MDSHKRRLFGWPSAGRCCPLCAVARRVTDTSPETLVGSLLSAVHLFAEVDCASVLSVVLFKSFLSMNLFPTTAGRRHAGRYWLESRDGDEACREIFDRHYSRYVYADGRQPKLFVGPGEKCVLISEDGTALFVWRKFISGDGQQGVNCAVFRNEGDILSSTLILAAEDIAWNRWPGERLFTYVQPKLIRSTNPGACFKHADWQKCGVTKWNKLVILEKLPCLV